MKEKFGMRARESEEWEKTKKIFGYFKKPLVFQKLVLWNFEIFLENRVVSHIQDFGDATTSPAGDAASSAGDAGVGVGDAHL